MPSFSIPKDLCRRKATTYQRQCSVSFPLRRRYLLPQPREVIMQNGSVVRRTRKKHPDIWQFRWWETTHTGKRVYRRREIGTVERIPNLDAARKAAALLVPELGKRRSRLEPTSMTIAQLAAILSRSSYARWTLGRAIQQSTFTKSIGDDGTRTRDLHRDRNGNFIENKRRPLWKGTGNAIFSQCAATSALSASV
jgi:hypothetical protein